MVRRASVNWGVEALSMLLPLGELEGQGWGVTNPVEGLSVAVGGGISSEFWSSGPVPPSAVFVQ